MLIQGSVQSRPQRQHSQAQPGVHPVSPLTHRTQRFERLPAPLGEPPYHFELKDAVPDIETTVAQTGHLVFHTVGDTGGIKNPQFQRAVAKAMKSDLSQAVEARPSFFFHLGDVVYYNGEHDQYYEQFYDPYDHYSAPIFSIPGNHDGAPKDASQISLDGWTSYFMTSPTHVDPVSQDAPRVTISQPNVYFTLNCPLVTLVGMYTNVPEHGSIDSVQQQWLSNELATAPDDKALIVCLHHPIYSFDDHHSGSARMADALQQAINDSRRVPNMVLTAHVHNYQRVERLIVGNTPTPFLVAGNGGYYHLHGMNADNGTKDPDTGAHLIDSNATAHGYVTLTVSKDQIEGAVTYLDNGGNANAGQGFSYPSAANFLPDGKIVSL